MRALRELRAFQAQVAQWRDLGAAGARAALGAQPESIFGLMREISPELDVPVWFTLYAEALERALKAPIRFAFSGPPQHGKTEIALHALVFAAIRYGDRRHAYVTFGLDRSRIVSRRLQALLTRAGVAYSGTLNDIRLSAPGPNGEPGGSIRLVSIARGLTGEPLDGLCLIDDPYRDAMAAATRDRRSVVEGAWKSTFVPRLHPTASAVTMCTRWHPEDFIAFLESRGVEYLNITAIAEEGDVLGRPLGAALCSLGAGAWAQARDAAWLASKRTSAEAGELTFQQQYQGRPRVVGASVFKSVTYYQHAPTDFFRVAFGVDLAYTESTKADWSVLLEMWAVDRHELGLEPLYYVIDVVRRQCEVADFAGCLTAANKRWPSAPMAWRCSGTERGAGSLLRRAPYNVSMQLKAPPGDKYMSALLVATAWNQGRVLVPSTPNWPSGDSVAAFVARVQNFTGARDGETDDEIDAMGTSHVLLPAMQATEPRLTGRRRPDRVA